MPLEYEETDLLQAAAARLKIPAAAIIECQLVKRAVDARRNKVHFTCTVDITVENEGQLDQQLWASVDIAKIIKKTPQQPIPGNNDLPLSPLIIGAGPAGLFCGLYLAQNGYQPVIIEQGQDMERRVETVEKFWQQGVLNPYCNTQFGEGGAGTFSDGKLTTRIGDERISYVLDTFVKHGANEEIRYVKKPHVGTDVIRKIIKNIRQEILDLGGELYFDSRMTDISVNQRLIKSIIINNSSEIPCAVLVLAVGNSAREVYRLLHTRDIELVPKAFAVGVRIEHPQLLIDQIQLGDFAGHPRLGPSDYHLTYQDRVSGRALYTFCMCPGGRVIAASSEAGGVVTNGMSYLARDTGIANSALVVTVKPMDWNEEVLGGIILQDRLEKRAFEICGRDYKAPAQRLMDFMARRGSKDLCNTCTTYQPGVKPADLWEILPPEIAEVLWRGIKYWDNRMPGFIDPGAVLTGVETRTSTPVRIIRNEEGCSLSIDNLYPCGEGAGYAGGIMSSAVDGLKTAEKIISNHRKPYEKVEIFDEEAFNARQL
ncbi:nad(fad)-utilizing dehydrogenase [hydrocarbon metagenome]|uniref:Nad(Fad)-utilizing dehydrogenase n=1 Tax=hydrocarbon metagenome TaxID=938273 RepID=A0A0W8E4E7_9ZZZZ